MTASGVRRASWPLLRTAAAGIVCTLLLLGGGSTSFAASERVVPHSGTVVAQGSGATTTAMTGAATTTVVPRHQPWEFFVADYIYLWQCVLAGSVGPWLTWTCETTIVNGVGYWALWAGP